MAQITRRRLRLRSVVMDGPTEAPTIDEGLEDVCGALPPIQSSFRWVPLQPPQRSQYPDEVHTAGLDSILQSVLDGKRLGMYLGTAGGPMPGVDGQVAQAVRTRDGYDLSASFSTPISYGQVTVSHVFSYDEASTLIGVSVLPRAYTIFPGDVFNFTLNLHISV